MIIFGIPFDDLIYSLLYLSFCWTFPFNTSLFYFIYIYSTTPQKLTQVFYLQRITKIPPMLIISQLTVLCISAMIIARYDALSSITHHILLLLGWNPATYGGVSCCIQQQGEDARSSRLLHLKDSSLEIPPFLHY